MSRLQVLIGDKWEYVFCSNDKDGIVTCKSKNNALRGRDLEYFKAKYANNEFKVGK